MYIYIYIRIHMTFNIIRTEQNRTEQNRTEPEGTKRVTSVNVQLLLLQKGLRIIWGNMSNRIFEIDPWWRTL